MVSVVQMEKVGELAKQGYVFDEEVAKKEWDGAFTTPSYMKNPKDGTIVKVGIDGEVTPYKPSNDGNASAPPRKKPQGPGF